ncbi:Tetraspanin-9 [Holothuria leucospilota]|uniref:Tetraspanin n=1 Tax=Holothuria leucospilota TaxID=206669 RepID=A0A9Q0YJ28_HOLLE|nr:Tetraspanin-9 [Holothuria leucospilota]
MATVGGFARVIKYLLFLFTFVFVVTGIILLSLGIALHTKEQAFAVLLPTFPFLNVGNLLIAVGIIVFLVSFLGCFGAMRESRLLLLLFIGFLLLIFILEMAIGGLGYRYRNEVTDFVTDDLKDGLMQYMNDTSYMEAWDQIQSELMCCGVVHPDDWYRNSTFKQNQVPDSCCKPENIHPMCGRDGSAVYNQGCKQVMIIALQSNLAGVAAGGIIIALFEVLGMVCACLVLVSIRRDKKV